MSVFVGPIPIIQDKSLVLNFDASFSINYLLNKVEVLVVAGGGGGGYYAAGAGGGGGGVSYNPNYPITSTSAITVTVGNGGAGGIYSPATISTNGQNSVFGNITSIGGGRGGEGWAGVAGGSGGSGGGGGGFDGSAGTSYISGGSGTSGQGFNGGRGKGISGNRGAGGGGGGAGGPGGDASNIGSGNGGKGLPFNISGVMRYYGGGGGGGDYGGATGGFGGIGGGGTRSGSNSSSQVATPGAPNSGGGGGGSRSATSDSWNGSSGGSGIVIVRYPGPQKATGGNTITSSGGYTIHTFTSSGTFTPLAAPANSGAVYGLQDLSGNNNTGTQSGGVTYSSANGGSLTFDGSDDYVTLSETLTNSGNLTYCAWVYRSVVSPNGYTNLFTSTIQNEQFSLDLTGYPGGFGVYLNGSFNSTDSNVIPLNTWVYLCWRREGTGIYGYLNGVEQFNATTGNTFGYGYNNSTAVSRINKIGAYSGGTSYNLNGKLGPVHMYNRALTQSEITQNFNALRGRFGI